jgi:membrane protease YdiL (CAAX protease family)
LRKGEIREGPPVVDWLLGRFMLLLTLIAGDDLKRIFIQRGKWRPALSFGGGSFLVSGVIACLPSIYPGGFISSLPAVTLWLFVFTFSHAIMEQRWLRGIFLRKYERLTGKQSAIIVTALVFGATHLNTTYAFPGSGWIFGLVVFVLGWIGAEAMYKCSGLIAPILFHVAYDLVVIVPVLNSGQDFQEGYAQCTN